MSEVWEVRVWDAVHSRGWTVKYCGPDEIEANRIFEKHASTRRQGFVQLITPQGRKITEPNWAVCELVGESR